MRVAVVGGGLSGLAAAHRLRALLGEAVTITVLEQGDRLGGKLRTVELAGLRYDVGAEAYLHRRPEVTELIGELGLAGEVVHPSGAPSTVAAGGHRSRIPARTMMGVPASADAVREVLSADGLASVAAEPSLPPVTLDGADVAVGALVRDRLGDEVADRLVDPLLGGVYAGRADALGLRATMPALAAALDAGAGSLLAAASASLPDPDPGAPRTPVFATLRGGLGMLVGALAAGLSVRLSTTVRGLRRTGSGWRLELGSAANPEALDADAVVLAVPAPAVRKLLGDVAPAASAAFGRIELASMAVVALALPAGAVLPPASGVLIAAGERHADGTPFTAKAFTFSSRKWSHLAGAGVVVVRGSVGRFGEVGVLRREDADLVGTVRADLAELTGITAAPVDAVVTRWGGGLPQYGVGHTDTVATIERAVGELPGLAVAGAALHGVGLPACVATGRAAADRVAAHLLRNRGSRGGTISAWPASTTPS
ncbi:protoporphyrinogen oxidase [Gandjariella thermophila]|uniref:Coproporphyrinogen III oxidase n=1 Tax=Gandjariella thermophila TaxID=1931992 RepID=A0A4D4JD61_9PSEU|nr:protoporphyrinogen oxidase [Gandjariella thermophila]GDY32950.1 protoporphyrinogen oxidase [Gandjariella thermophila]